MVSDDLHAVSPDTGVAWIAETPTSHAATGKAAAATVAFHLLAALGGGTAYGTAHAEVTHNICSQPVLHGDHLYFAAIDKVYCLDPDTGEVAWESELGEESGSMILYPAGERIGVVGLGYTYIDGSQKSTSPPSVTLLDASSGEIVGQFQFDPEVRIVEEDENARRRRRRGDRSEPKTEEAWDYVRAAGFTAGRHYVLTANDLYQFDENLSLVGAMEAADEYGSFADFPFGTPVLVRTERGLLVLGTEPLGVEDFVDVAAAELGLIGDDIEESESATDCTKKARVVDDVLWMGGPSGRTVFAVRRTPEPRIVASADFVTTDWKVHRNCVSALSGREVMLFPVAVGTPEGGQ